MVGDQTHHWNSVCYNPVTIAHVVTGTTSAEFSVTSGLVTDSEPKYTTHIPGCRQNEQLTTCLPT